MSEVQQEFQHAMLREIFDQPAAIKRTLTRYMRDGGLNEAAFGSAPLIFRDHKDLVISASGSSRHAGLAAEIMLEDAAGLAVDVEYASEYITRSTNTKRDPAVMVISQSGETADTLGALREAKQRRHPTIAVTNVASSRMAQEADVSLPTEAGIEKAIPATKSFTTQLIVLRLLSLLSAKARGVYSDREVAEQLGLLSSLPGVIEKQLSGWNSRMAELAAVYQNAKTLLFLGRGIHYPIAREGALKLKESSYVHAEGYPTGELKHGPNALVSDEVPLVVLATVDRGDAESVLRYEKTLALLDDMHAQGARTVVVGNTGDEALARRASHVVGVSEVNEYLLPVCEVIPLQMFAYHMALLNGVDVDAPPQSYEVGGDALAMAIGSLERCTCGVQLEPASGPTHRYMLSTPSCWEAYGKLLAKEYENASLMRMHRLTVDAYAAQHPGKDGQQARNSVGIHLSRLALLLDEGWAMERANDAMLSITAKKRQYPWLLPPRLDDAGTFLPAIDAVGSNAHEAAVRTWATGVWHAWMEHHATVKSWLREAGLIT